MLHYLMIHAAYIPAAHAPPYHYCLTTSHYCCPLPHCCTPSTAPLLHPIHCPTAAPHLLDQGGDLAISFCNHGASLKVSSSTDAKLSDFVPGQSAAAAAAAIAAGKRVTVSLNGREDGPAEAASTVSSRGMEADRGSFFATPDISAFLTHVPALISGFINKDIPLLHIHLVYLAGGGSALALAVLHAYCDAMSVQRLVEVWVEACGREERGSSADVVLSPAGQGSEGGRGPDPLFGR